MPKGIWKHRPTRCKRGHDRTNSENITATGRCRICRNLMAKDYNAQYKVKHPMYWRNLHLKKAFGISSEDQEKKLQEQDGRCDICRRALVEPHVDHDHETNQLRALLCGSCNRALGLLQDSIPVVESALAYLKKWKA
jgi:hypothetical protein